jgi:hypothetical protein
VAISARSVEGPQAMELTPEVIVELAYRYKPFEL